MMVTTMARLIQTRRPVKIGESPTSQKLVGIPSGEAGVVQTLRYMSAFVEAFKINPVIRELSLKLIAHLPQKDQDGEVSALFDYVKYHIRYVRDIHNVETIQTPLKTLEYAAGDCDDKSTLLAAMLASIGYQTRFRAMGFTTRFCHVIVEALVNGRWISLDATEPESLGWLPDNITMQMFQQNESNDLGLWAELLTAAKGAVDKRKTTKDANKAASRQRDAERKKLIRDQEAQISMLDQKASAARRNLVIGGAVVVGLGLLWYINSGKR